MPLDPFPTLVLGLGGTGQIIACHVLRELMDLYAVQQPAGLPAKVQIRAIDTDFGFKAAVGFDLAGASAARVGKVALGSGQQIQVGDNVYKWVKEQVSPNKGRYPYLTNWFDVDYFSKHANAVGLLNLTSGAGQFRPLGRLALFYNLTFGGSLRTSLQNAISEIRTACGGTINKLNVCIAGSLCGGTGAGLAVDVAYLVRRLANAKSVNILGFWVLPQAFEATIHTGAGGTSDFAARAYAAMRELRRFARGVSNATYPLYYAGQEKEGDTVLRGRVSEALYNQLYYFDASLQRPKATDPATLEDVAVEEGVALSIAEAVLLHVDDAASNTVASHSVNLVSRSAQMQAAGNLDAEAAVAGGVGAYTLQLPLYHIVEGWSLQLGRQVLKDLLAVKEEDEATRTAATLRDDWAGGQPSPAGSAAARTAWVNGQVGGVTLGPLLVDHLTTGLRMELGPATVTQRQGELEVRPLAQWESMLAPEGVISESNEKLRSKFLWPREKTLQWQGLKRVTLPSEVQIAEGSHMDTASQGNYLRKEVEGFLAQHLGAQDVRTGARGGSDDQPSGEYPLLLRAWSTAHSQRWREALRAWMSELLNGLPDGQQGSADTGRLQRAGKVGHLLTLLQGQTSLWQQASAALVALEKAKLAEVIQARNNVAKPMGEMQKSARKQGDYLQAQQQVLEAERLYAAARAARWVAQQVQAYTQRTWQATQKWQTALAQELYRSVWMGQEQVRENRKILRAYGAVREMLDLPELEEKRYDFYAAGKLGGILNDLRWQVSLGEEFDREAQLGLPYCRMQLALRGQELPMGGGANTARAFLERCREVFRDAYGAETALRWLMLYYDDTTPQRTLPALAQRLVTRVKVPLRHEALQQEYRVGYVRAHYANSDEHTWLDRLKELIVNQSGTDAQHSNDLDSSDPYRLSFLVFKELMDVRKLRAYDEGYKGAGGNISYSQLTARAVPNGPLARQLLHVFPAEHNACIYEELLGEPLPDRLVPLLEDMDNLRLFMRAWAYGEVARYAGAPGPDESEGLAAAGATEQGSLAGETEPAQSGDDGGRQTLIGRMRSEGEAGEARWVRCLTAGPFEEDLDRNLSPTNRSCWWLTEPQEEMPPLLLAAECFLLSGQDRWQFAGELALDYDLVRREVERQQAWLAGQPDLGARNPALQQGLRKLPKGRQKELTCLKLANLEHLQRVGKFLDEYIKEQSGKQAGAAHPAGFVLDLKLLILLQRVMQAELTALSAQINNVINTSSSAIPVRPARL